MADSQQGTKRSYDEINSPDHLQSGFQRFFNSESFSDITIISGSQSFHAHKLVLSAQSDYFASIFSGPWKMIPLALLRPCFGSSIISIPTPPSPPVEVSTTLFNVMLYITSDKYMIPNLKCLAK
ncbi:BTB/POZ domain-containing protein [Penicillium subrubescens]|uniref:BTB/POZ domain-containing protein n=1 Tax=Penicillium subrubescens TaxID=1316194 RepID=UPI002545901B|nr:BTB/POZ domain-containing protein [Penicillium subrubescens]KAJ5911273.1 BTB/POZ domain-containing protein [Penicillium subrubescens]